MAGVGSTGEENVVVRVACNGTEVTFFYERFMGVVKVCLLNKKEVWAKVMN